MIRHEPHTGPDGKYPGEGERLTLRLYIAGASVNSRRAVVNVRGICSTHLKGRHTLEIIDVYQQKELAEKEQLVALPMLIKTAPLPPTRLVGDMSDTDKVLRGLGLVV